MISPEDFAAFQSVLDRAKLYVLVTHVNPDGDAIGSQVGLGRYLMSLGFEVRIVNQDKIKNHDGQNYVIRDGIVVVPKGAVVDDGTVI